MHLVGQTGPTWAQLGPQDGAQIAPKSMPKLMSKIDASWTSIFGVFFKIWEGKRGQVGTKMEPKIDIAGKAKKPKII